MRAIPLILSLMLLALALLGGCGGEDPCLGVTGIMPWDPPGPCTPVFSRKEAVCLRWKQAQDLTVSGGWTPGSNPCDPGTVSKEVLASALRMTNMYRYLAGLPDVTLSDTFNKKAQACAVLMKENGTINHYPPKTWSCYSADGAEAAQSSNLALGSDATRAVYRFMQDNGNATTLGHRRWIIGNWFGPTGFGTTGKFTCQWVKGGTKDTKEWAAWPPPLEVPLSEVFDTTGWSWQSDTINPSGVKVTVGGVDMPMTVTPLKSGFGSRHAIAFRPQGWKTEADKVYEVTITGPKTITYQVKPVNCP